MSKNEIRVKMHGGYLVAERNIDPNYDGISIIFETESGYIVDVVVVECREENYKKKKIDVYCYEDECMEDFTRKYTLDSEEIYKALDI